MNLQENTFHVQQLSTNEFTLSSVAAAGSFVAGNPPNVNLEEVSRNIWQSDFTTTNASSFTLSFVGFDATGQAGRYWGLPTAGTQTLPAAGIMIPSSSAGGVRSATIFAPPGSYRITFNALSGEYSVQQRYAAGSSVNYLKNPSFESVAGGYPSDWGSYQAISGTYEDFGAHSGARCGVLQPKLFENWSDYGNFDQTTTVLSGLSGQTFRVSAAFRTHGDWRATSVRIIIEWKRGNETISETFTELTGLNENWRIHALETPIPEDAVAAHILFKYDGVEGNGYLLIDDAEARVAASRFQNFDAWGSINQFTNISPDWAVSSGKTMLNASDQSPIGGVLISKYIEGTGNNKAIEIFNGTSASVDLYLEGYRLEQYDNAASTATVSIAFSPPNNVLRAGETLLVSRPYIATNAYPPDPEILAADTKRLQTNALTFNGDDVVVLRKGGANGAIVDRVGQVGQNAFGSHLGLTMTDHSLHRRANVLWGLSNAPTAAFSPSEWTVLPKDDFSELGTHAFSLDDPDAPFIPSGYSLLLNTNASLTSPALDGGIGNISFYARAQAAASGAPIEFVVETASSPSATQWTAVETFSLPLNTTNFTRISCFANRQNDSAIRIRHLADGTTNRLRLDDILVEAAYLVSRSENFSAWGSVENLPVGTYTVAEWTVQNAQITSAGAYDTLGAALYPEDGTVTSPTFAAGVGAVTLWLSHHPEDNGAVAGSILTSTNQGGSWTSRGTFSLPAASGDKRILTNLTFSIYEPAPSAMRISSAGSPSPFMVDNIVVGLPSLVRRMDFNSISKNSSYASYEKDGWVIIDAIIETNNAASGNSARLRNGYVQSPYLPDIGIISFYVKQFSSDTTAALLLQASTDGRNWTTLDANVPISTALSPYSYYNTNTTYHYIRISQTTNNKRINIDDIFVDEIQPAPSVLINPTVTLPADPFKPATPAAGEAFYVAADILPQNGAEILAVTGFVRIASRAWTNYPMETVAYGSYRSPVITGLTARTRVQYYVVATYGGAGADPGQPGYSTNRAASVTNSFNVPAVKKGTVWINEIFYGSYLGEGGFWGNPYDHEFIELCGVAGTDMGNWQIQLAFATASDVQKNNGQAVYATYTIPESTALADTDNGFGFYVLGDPQLRTNMGARIDQELTIFVSSNVAPSAVMERDHIHTRSGVIRLLDSYGNLVYSLSYGAYSSGADRIPVSQSGDTAHSLSLGGGQGSTYDDFTWNNQNNTTIGGPNTGQELVPEVERPLMPAWHSPGAVAVTAQQGTFHLFEPLNAAQSQVVDVHYAYTNADFTYAGIGGVLHHRRQGGSTWATADKIADFPGNYDSHGLAYLRMRIPAYTYQRLDTLEYVIEAIPNRTGLATAYLGSNGNGGSTAYRSLEEAQDHPFVHTFPIADPIEITRMTLSNSVVYVQTDGNDALDPIIRFRIRSTTNLLMPTDEWEQILPQAISRTNEQNYMRFPQPPGNARHFAVEPLWP
ncbi:MAG: lamin tail domain-containing protein [Verrucomicrobiota bacterium]|nr:lamin tail domain-containing protein [Verrucomicrobiota bacterium]